jgi:hypothetical protein
VSGALSALARAWGESARRGAGDYGSASYPPPSGHAMLDASATREGWSDKSTRFRAIVKDFHGHRNEEKVDF